MELGLCPSSRMKIGKSHPEVRRLRLHLTCEPLVAFEKEIHSGEVQFCELIRQEQARWKPTLILHFAPSKSLCQTRESDHALAQHVL